MNRAVLAFSILVFTFQIRQLPEEKPLVLKEAPGAIGVPENPNARNEYELMQVVNPATGTVPGNMRERELTFAKALNERHQVMRLTSPNNTVWSSLGPSNIGGRTRAVAFDVRNQNILLAGGVSGGMWKCDFGDVNSTWERKSDVGIRNSISCIAQDKRTGKQDTWYYGTGELLGNSARGGAAPYRGDGIFKSTDNGSSWTQLASTRDSSPAVFGSQFQYIWNILPNRFNEEEDEVYVAAYGGILRSSDGGNSWEGVLGEELFNLPSGTNLNQSIAPFFTNIIQNDQGHFFAALSRQTSGNSFYTGAGFYWSETGESWYKLSNILPVQRTVMDAKGNQVYFFTNTNENSSLYQFTLQSINPDGSPNGQFVDLTPNLPSGTGTFDKFNVQGGYNMVVKAHPTISNVVILGVTNLYRSTDGFTSSNNTKWIGGYNTQSNGQVYPNHHPDQHDMLFFENGDVLCANDGGLFRTSDIMATEVAWTPLNTGYITTQYYTINILKDTGKSVALGGMQDNGTAITTSNLSNAPWSRVIGGDGGYTSTVPFGLYWYASFQDSQIYRLTLGSDGLTSFARVDPTNGASGTGSSYLFINPYILDARNPNMMYLAGGNSIWRNNNLLQIPAGSQNTTKVNWDLLTRPSERTVGTISALEITQSSNILYYGSSNGELRKIENPGTPTQETHVNIWQSNLPTNAYVSCIASNPENENEILVIFSNYGIPSIFHSTDGGLTFTDVSGDLEDETYEDGPSVRWAEIIPMNSGPSLYFVGTSTGLYKATGLNGTSTNWMQDSPQLIGNSVITMMDYHLKDGILVVATHGNGVFRSAIAGYKRISDPVVSGGLKLVEVFPNPIRNSANPARIRFIIPKAYYMRVDIYDMQGALVRNILYGAQYPGMNTVSWDGLTNGGQPVADGVYVFRISYDGQIIGGRIVVDRKGK
jgi:photosystem II stability/assembly factor-like uncharacterized protein